jgi:hypothetical protein
MSPNAFIGKTKSPSDPELAEVLGPTKATWDHFLADLAENLDANKLEWKSYSIKYGWALRVCRKARTIVWLAPFQGSFEVLFLFGDKAMQAARQTKLNQRVVKSLDEAVKYPEGTGVRLVVRSSRDLASLNKLAAIKHAN